MILDNIPKPWLDNEIQDIESKWYQRVVADIESTPKLLVHHVILQDTLLIDVEDDNITYEWVATKIDISSLSLFEKFTTKKFQIKHGLKFVTTSDRLIAFLSFHGRMTFRKSQNAVMAAAFETASSGNNQVRNWNKIKTIKQGSFRKFDSRKPNYIM